MGTAGFGVALLLERDVVSDMLKSLLTQRIRQVLGAQVGIGCGADLAEGQFGQLFFSAACVIAKNRKLTAVSVRWRISEV